MPLDPEKRRACSLAYYYRNREKSRAYKAQYRAKHREEIRAYNARYLAEHAEEHQAYNAHYRAENVEKRRAYNKRYHEEHREERRAYLARYYAEHPGKRTEHGRRYWIKNRMQHVINTARYRAMKRNAPVHDFTAKQWTAMKEMFQHRCAYCGKKPKRLEMDHITPIVKGGSHTVSNIVPACRSCNGRKGKGDVLTPIQPLLFTI
jgi:5-methylcytosine-specific restriction endonuclease McrA